MKNCSNLFILAAVSSLEINFVEISIALFDPVFIHIKSKLLAGERIEGQN